MATTNSSRLAAQMCSVFAGANGEAPAGTAPTWGRCLIIELPKPWEGEVEHSRHFPGEVTQVLEKAEANGSGAQLLCVAPDPEYSVEGYSRVMLFSRPERPFATYDKREYLVPAGDVGPLADALVNAPGSLGRFERFQQETPDVRDILVCTHGSHDVCCATKGYPIYQVLRREYAGERGGGIRVWRVSHLGGHRFAPNLVDLPQGRNWVRVGPDQLEPLMLHTQPVSELRSCYRGWVALGSPYEQVAEQEVFMREGWGWAERMISTQLLEAEDNGRGARVRIEFTDPATGVSGAYEATVEQREAALRTGCLEAGEPFETPQYGVTRLVKVA